MINEERNIYMCPKCENYLIYNGDCIVMEPSSKNIFREKMTSLFVSLSDTTEVAYFYECKGFNKLASALYAKGFEDVLFDYTDEICSLLELENEYRTLLQTKIEYLKEETSNYEVNARKEFLDSIFVNYSYSTLFHSNIETFNNYRHYNNEEINVTLVKNSLYALFVLLNEEFNSLANTVEITLNKILSDTTELEQKKFYYLYEIKNFVKKGQFDRSKYEEVVKNVCENRFRIKPI